MTARREKMLRDLLRLCIALMPETRDEDDERKQAIIDGLVLAVKVSEGT